MYVGIFCDSLHIRAKFFQMEKNGKQSPYGLDVDEHDWLPTSLNSFSHTLNIEFCQDVNKVSGANSL